MTPTRTALRWSESFVVGVLVAAAPIQALKPDELYARGRMALESSEPDYVVALESFAAYREAAAEILAQHPDFHHAVHQAIAHSAGQLNLALRTKRELDKYGEVREVAIETEGKLDDFGVPPRPRLDPRPPPTGKSVLEAGVFEHKAQFRPIEPVSPPSPPPPEPACARRLSACQKTSEAHAERLAHCERRLEALTSDAGTTRALDACRERLAGTSEKCQQLQERFNDLAARYLEIEKQCRGG